MASKLIIDVDSNGYSSIRASQIFLYFLSKNTICIWIELHLESQIHSLNKNITLKSVLEYNFKG